MHLTTSMSSGQTSLFFLVMNESVELSMTCVLDPTNTTQAYSRVVKNGGSAGIDNMSTESLGDYLNSHRIALRSSLLSGSYQPSPVRQVEIPKPSGGKRNLGIPTVLDRYIQQSLSQVLIAYYDPMFSDHSYGFRPGRGTQEAVSQSLSYLRAGYEYVVVIDIANYFGSVNHDQLMTRLSKDCQDKVFLKLIRKYLRSGVMINGVKHATTEGTPQGGNLSPVLSNLFLDYLDKELERRGHRFVRYADDISIYVKSARAGERVLISISDWITKRLKLAVNQDKSGVFKYTRANLFGFGFYKDADGIQLRISKPSLRRFREKLRYFTNRSRSCCYDDRVVDINSYTTGWLWYFGWAKGRNHLKTMDEWLRRRLRQTIWCQWKRVRTRIRSLQKLGVHPELAYQWGNTRKGSWAVSKSPVLHRTITNKRLEQRGYESLLEKYNYIHENLSNRRDTRTVCPVV